MSEVAVRMGELHVSGEPGVVLVAAGLGSCIGLGVVDRAAGVAGLAHVMRPGPGAGEDRPPGTFGDTAVLALLAALEALGARRRRARVTIVGGAQMFGRGGAGLNLGARNEEAVRAALRDLGLQPEDTRTGGGSGRTMRVHVDGGRITARTAGGTEEELLGSPIGVPRERRAQAAVA
jgi:chemotaxis protein CheD